MKLDDDICCCYHVPLRKLLQFARQRRLQRASQMSECFGAGTGCGWCIPILTMIFERTRDGRDVDLAISPEEYVRRRAEYRTSGAARHTFAPDAGEAPPAAPHPGEPPPIPPHANPGHD
ncbi:MAG: hypothetical protein CHACPFDD_01214 [Phycisphaerae bacterium]|nr:hypothetical protein [Phycisphaerae bacterium]